MAADKMSVWQNWNVLQWNAAQGRCENCHTEDHYLQNGWLLCFILSIDAIDAIAVALQKTE